MMSSWAAAREAGYTFVCSSPGVSLRSTPGFMLSPASRAPARLFVFFLARFRSACYRGRGMTTAEAQRAPIQTAPLTPPLKWAGGKRWLLPHLEPLWQLQRHRRYVEPFCGGLAVALGLKPERALLNDANPHLINFYRQVQRGLKMHLEMRYDESLFYAHRDRFNCLIAQGKAETAEAAQLFYYLNRTCFNLR